MLLEAVKGVSTLCNNFSFSQWCCWRFKFSGCGVMLLG